jgi:hypothetical protein
LPASHAGRFGHAFDVPYTLDGGGTETFAYSLHGQVGANRASGTFQVVITDKDAAGATTDTCDSTLERWTARSTKGEAPTTRGGEVKRV